MLQIVVEEMLLGAVEKELVHIISRRNIANSRRRRNVANSSKKKKCCE